MKTVRRLTTLVLLASIGAFMTGCVVLPFGDGYGRHGRHGRGDFRETSPSQGERPRFEAPREGSARPGR
jgi:hypothetical protein